MGREIRRVAADFDWPLRKVWSGFINPAEKCPACDGVGISIDASRLEAFFRLFALAAEDSFERPEGYDTVLHEKAITFTEAFAQVRASAPSDVTVKGMLDLAAKTGISLGVFMSGFLALREGLDPDLEAEREPPTWPFTQDVVGVIEGMAGMTLSEHDASVLRRIAGVVPILDRYRPHSAVYVWVEGQRKVRLVPGGGMYYPHPYLCEGAGIADVGPTFHAIYEALPGITADGSLGRYSNNIWKTIQALMAQVGVTKEAWYDCPSCGGDGWAARHAWERTDPPAGDAYQLWETVSEGSPLSPPFPTPQALADWLVLHNTHDKLTHPQWVAFIEGPGWAPSGIGDGETLENGVEYMGRTAGHRAEG